MVALLRTVSVVGLAPMSVEHVLAEEEGTEIWGMNQAHHVYPPEVLQRFTRWFQIHPWEAVKARTNRAVGHEEWLANCQIPVYMEEVQPEIPASVRYPFENVTLTIGSNYFACNTFCYMLALAIHEGFDKIRLYGEDMGPHDLGDGYARPCMEFLMGMAMGTGKEIWVAPESHLMVNDLYGRTLDQPALLAEKILDQARFFEQHTRYGDDRTEIRELIKPIEDFYNAKMRGVARHRPWLKS